MEQWEKNYYITALAGVINGSSLVVMSKGQLESFTTSVLEFSGFYYYYLMESQFNDSRHTVLATVIQSQ